jgi:hypothetical protein
MAFSITPKLTRISALCLVTLIVACSNQEFSGESGARQPVKPKVPPLTPPVLVDNPPIKQDEIKTDDGQTLTVIPGTPVSRVGVGFEDLKDFDFNDVYLCFAGNFNVNGRDIISNRDQSIQATWGNISAISHYVTITITDPDGKELFNKGFQGTKNTKLMGTIPLTFTKGSKLNVMIAHKSTKHTDAKWAVVHLDQCNNTGK